MSNQTQYRAPKWAIELKKQYQYFKSDCRDDEAYGVFHAGRLALESQFGCSFGDSTGFFQSELDPIESDDFGIVEPEFKVGDCVKNISSGYLREFGPKGVVEYGVITKVCEGGFYVQWDGCRMAYYCKPNEVEMYKRD